MLMIVCKNIYKTVVIKICASICNDKMTTNERFPSPMLCPCIHTHFITLVFVCRGRSIPVLPPSLSQSIPQLWCHQPSESLIYCLRLRFIKCGVKVGALKSFCACVCVWGGERLRVLSEPISSALLVRLWFKSEPVPSEAVRVWSVGNACKVPPACAAAGRRACLGRCETRLSASLRIV